MSSRTFSPGQRLLTQQPSSLYSGLLTPRQFQSPRLLLVKRKWLFLEPDDSLTAYQDPFGSRNSATMVAGNNLAAYTEKQTKRLRGHSDDRITKRGKRELVRAKRGLILTGRRWVRTVLAGALDDWEPY